MNNNMISNIGLVIVTAFILNAIKLFSHAYSFRISYSKS